MTLNPQFAGQKLSLSGGTETKHTLEFLRLRTQKPDTNPATSLPQYSAIFFNTFYPTITPLLSKNAHYRDNLQVIFRQQIQPWHPSSTLTHEAGVAVLKLAPEKFWPFSAALFARQTEFFDANVVNETRNETYARLAKIAAGVGVDEAALLKMLAVSDKPDEQGDLNGGNGVTGDLKVMVKASRLIGVHFTPTVYFDGVEERTISSRFTAEQWEKWLEKNVV
ncbi:uncharacterized protein PADG_02764 [Paracoccidioides brasiliensis Pb18]|uniref:Thioredoxin-like fold domain-containing protein n=2 Tax=Paracoccidioides brasiliensis TaxID=121759 RepID=C1G6F9_PARBD|nr:uncharacterized protein PADG_02764 [Paracoccidioides brasiliensis Pb18]EEH46666.2 hypothetical protein PADG_02764 [Paracoccidioides brasiliensis Pb18]ODH25892.1 hypothetical protein ACO22_04992 [Paracoccidioides brasiliensis]ODH50339.1 hypothetical protein GX48_03454 [Paracoccidioides brasiliensis]